MEVCCYNRNNCSRHSVIIMRVMNIQKAYKPKYQPFNRGGNIKRKRMYKTVDSIDIQIEVAPVSVMELAQAPKGESSADIRQRVVAARAIQTERYKNAPFDVCKSSAENTFFNRWSEIKHNVILHWVDEAEERGNYAMALYSDHTTSYQHGSDYPLGLTLQYSGQGLWGRNYLIDRSTQVKYSLMPHTGTWQIL